MPEQRELVRSAPPQSPPRTPGPPLSAGTVRGGDTALADPAAFGLIQIGVRPTLRQYLRGIWERRQFATTLALGELRAQNQNTTLGSVWHLLNPLMMVGVYYLIFGVILDARRGVPNYPAFLVTGVFAFFFSQKVIIGGCRVVVGNAKIIQTINFPRALLPVASVLQESLAQLPALAAMLALVAATGGEFHPTWALLIPIWLIQSVFNLGATLVVARITFHFRDTQFIVPYFMRIWFYLSGVFFGAEYIDARAASHGTVGSVISSLFRLNPMYGFIRLTRDAVLEGTTSWPFWRNVIGAALVALIVGFVFFRQREEQYSRL